MARSQIGRLRAISQKEAKARELLERIQQEREKIVAPTRTKIEGIFSRVLSALVRERLEAVVGLRLNQSALEKDLREVLERHLPMRSADEAKKPDPDLAAAKEEDDLSLQISAQIDNLEEDEETPVART
jgi:hypothetical protein